MCMFFLSCDFLSVLPNEYACYLPCLSVFCIYLFFPFICLVLNSSVRLSVYCPTNLSACLCVCSIYSLPFPVCLPVCLLSYTFLSVCQSVCCPTATSLPVNLFVVLPICPSTCLFVILPTCRLPVVYLSVCCPPYLSVYLSVCWSRVQ